MRLGGNVRVRAEGLAYPLGVVVRERFPLGGQHQAVRVVRLLELAVRGVHQGVGAWSGHGAQHHRSPFADSELHSGQRLEGDAAFAERLEQLRRADPPFEADEHGVGVELPDGLKTGQYITHAAHRMRR
ncbi:hypothetical protein SANTM175S_09271 [Streptomyces antimycoticus]